MDDGRRREGVADAVEERGHLRRVDVARPAVTQVGHRCQPAEHGHRAQVGRHRQEAALVAEQHHRRRGGLPGQCPVSGRGEDRPVRGVVEDVGEPQEGGHRGLDPGGDVGTLEATVGDGVGQVVGPLLSEGHLDLETGRDRQHRVAQPGDEVRRHESVPPPLGAQYGGQQLGVLTAPLTVDRVVRGHHRCHPSVGDGAEMWQVHLVERPFVDRHVDPEPGLLHRVAREVLHAGHDVVLQPPGQRGGHRPDMVGILAVRLLGPPPAGVSQQVHAHSAGVRGTHGAQLGPDGPTDPLLESGVEGGPACHGNREAGGGADDAAPGAVGERDAGDTEPGHGRRRPRVGVVAAGHHVDDPVPEVEVAVEAPELLVQGHGVHERPGLRVVVGPGRHAPGGPGERAVRGGCRLVDAPLGGGGGVGRRHRARSTWRFTTCSRSS